MYASDVAPSFDPSARRSGRRLFGVFALLTVALAAIGAAAFDSLSAALLEQENERLMAVANLKARQLSDWLGERRNGVRRSAHSPLANQLLRHWTETRDGAAAQQLADWLEFVRANEGYAGLYILDRNGVPLFGSGRPEAGARPVHANEVRAVLEQPDPLLVDLHLGHGNGAYLSFMAAIRDPRDEDETPTNVLLISIDPGTYLFSLMRFWPTPSASGETLLIRQEGDEVVYLSELRQRPDAALHFRLPLSSPELPAAWALRNGDGLFEGRDYRGVPVLSANRRVDDSPWRLLAKIDRAEVVRDINRLAVASAAMVFVAIAGSAALLGLLWQRQRLRESRVQTAQAHAIVALSERFRALVESASDAFFAHDLQGRFVEVNQRACESTGYSRDELLGMGVSGLEPELDLLAARESWSALQPGMGLTRVGRQRRKDGSTFPVEVRVSSCLFAGQRLVLALVRDVSDRLRNENALRQRTEELQARNRELAQMNAELEEFAFVASHDLKAPLRAVANLAHVIDEDSAQRLDDESRGRLRKLRERIMRMDTLIDGLLAYARLGRTTGGTVAVPLGPLLTELVEDLRLPPECVVQLEPPLPTLKADRMQLRQIFQNLILNAFEHNDASTRRVWIRAHDLGDGWQLDVADDGPGIREVDRTRVFRMFSTCGAPERTGIGLAVVRKLVLGQGGRVEVFENEPRGAVFRIFWPK